MWVCVGGFCEPTCVWSQHLTPDFPTDECLPYDRPVTRRACTLPPVRYNQRSSARNLIKKDEYHLWQVQKWRYKSFIKLSSSSFKLVLSWLFNSEKSNNVKLQRFLWESKSKTWISNIRCLTSTICVQKSIMDIALARGAIHVKLWSKIKGNIFCHHYANAHILFLLLICNWTALNGNEFLLTNPMFLNGGRDALRKKRHKKFCKVQSVGPLFS